MLDATMASRPGTTVRAYREPKYWALKQHLLGVLRSLPPGAPIPTERSLATEFGVSRTTVRQALAELTVEGRLWRVQGKGTFVAKPKRAQHITLGGVVDAGDRGLSSKLLHIGEQPADATLAELLELRIGTPVGTVSRLRSADGQPTAVETTHLPLPRFPGVLGRLGGSSVVEVLEREFGVAATRAEDTIETALAGPEEAELLGGESGLPTLLRSHLALGADGRPLWWSRSVYRGDRSKFVATLGPAAGVEPRSASAG